MGKHKHRRSERDLGYGQPQMNGGYNGTNGMNTGQMGMSNQFMGNGMNPAMNMNQQGMNPGMNPGMMNGQGMNPNIDQGMNQGMNPNINQGINSMGMNQNMNPMGSMGNMMSNPIASLLGGLGGGLGGTDLNGIIQLLNGFGLGIDPGLAGLFGGGSGGSLDIMQMLSGLLGGGGFGNTNNAVSQGQSSVGKSPGSLDELLSQINPNQINLIQSILQGVGVNSNPQQSTVETSGEKKDDSLEDILANLDFNSILNNLNSENSISMDFSNIDNESLDDIDINQVASGEEFDENMGEIKDADIVEENILNKERELTKDEYKKLINILIKLIDPNKIRLLQKVFNQFEKKTEAK